jgi:hypothetical protein
MLPIAAHLRYQSPNLCATVSRTGLTLPGGNTIEQNATWAIKPEPQQTRYLNPALGARIASEPPPGPPDTG